MKLDKKLFWIYTLNSSVYFLQGIGSIAGQPLQYYLKETLHLSQSLMMFISGFITLAWLVKPLIGYCIDNFGIKRKYWIIGAITLDILIALFLGLATLPLLILVTSLTLGNFSTAFRDVSVDGIMVCEGKKENKCDKIQVVQWISLNIAGIISTLIGAYLAEKYISYKIGFLCLIPFYLIGMIFAIKYKEDKSDTKKESLKNALIKYKGLIRTKSFLIAIGFLFFFKFAPSFGTALWFIERDTFHWSRFFIGIMGVISTIAGIGGMLLYNKIGSKINLKKWLQVGIGIGVITTLSYLYFTPITDVVYTIIYSFVGSFIFLATMTFMANNCVKGLESTSFALLCSVSNLAGSCSLWAGGALIELTGLKPLIIISAFSGLICLAFMNKLNVGEKNE